MTSPAAPSGATLQRKLRSQRIISLILAIGLAFVGVAYAQLWSDTKDLVGATPEATAPTGGTAAPENLDTAQQAPQELSSAPYMTLGSDDAPITITEWTDFTCPYCGLFHRETLPEIITEYIDTGKVRLIVHDVTFIGDQAEDAAVAARAAGQQDHYFEYLFALYDLGADGAKPNLDETQLTVLAEELGLDMTAFETGFADASIRQTVQASTAQAQSIGISAVPFFLVSQTGTLEGAQQLRGAQELSTFQQVLDAELATIGE